MGRVAAWCLVPPDRALALVSDAEKRARAGHHRSASFDEAAQRWAARLHAVASVHARDAPVGLKARLNLGANSDSKRRMAQTALAHPARDASLAGAMGALGSAPHVLCSRSDDAFG